MVLNYFDHVNKGQNHKDIRPCNLFKNKKIETLTLDKRRWLAHMSESKCTIPSTKEPLVHRRAKAVVHQHHSQLYTHWKERDGTSCTIGHVRNMFTCILKRVTDIYPHPDLLKKNSVNPDGHLRRGIQTDTVNTLLLVLMHLAFGQQLQIPYKDTKTVQALCNECDDVHKTTTTLFVKPALRDMLAALHPEYLTLGPLKHQLKMHHLMHRNLAGRVAQLKNKFKKGTFDQKRVLHRLKQGMDPDTKEAVANWDGLAINVQRDKDDTKGLEHTLFRVLQQHVPEFRDSTLDNLAIKPKKITKRNVAQAELDKWGTDFDSQRNVRIRCDADEEHEDEEEEDEE